MNIIRDVPRGIYSKDKINMVISVIKIRNIVCVFVCVCKCCKETE